MVTKSSGEEHRDKARSVLHRVNEANIRLKFEECKLAALKLIGLASHSRVLG